MENLRKSIEIAKANSITVVTRDRKDDIEVYVKEINESPAGLRVTRFEGLHKLGKLTGYRLEVTIT